MSAARRFDFGQVMESRPSEDQDFLAALGARVRHLRALRGMSRKVLARVSGISERYIAQLESGQGNVSIKLLRRVAVAMGVRVEDLIVDEAAPQDWPIFRDLLRTAAPAQMAEARAILSGASPVPAAGRAAPPADRVALIGLRGAGKSTLGAKLAATLGIPFVELDREIERLAGMSLASLFDLYGQGAYRRYERRALESVIETYDRAVIAAGGSLVSEPATFDLLLSACFTVWLTARPEEHMSRVMAQGDLRPMADNTEATEDLRRILDGRAALYSKADVTVETAGKSVEQSLALLKSAVAETPA
jgi:XRE family aerobic/anaerobic benzoate catabolism transcriptional regulator